MTLAVATGALALVAPAIAAPCGGIGAHAALDPSAAFAGNAPGVSNIWGAANVVTAGADGVRVAFPKGSINPGNAAAPGGGGGFALALAAHAETRCLRYQARFDSGFAFAKGGKLPGLYGGSAPRGCTPAALAGGFSARLMWRAHGDGELYLYAPGRGVRCGESIARGAWRFTAGAWTQIAEEVRLNAPGAADGRIRVWIDGALVIERTDLTLRERPGIGVDGLLFSTFFGGDDASWASPQNQFATFRGFEIWDGPATP